MSGYLTSTSLLRIDGLSTNPQVLGRHKNIETPTHPYQNNGKGETFPSIRGEEDRGKAEEISLLGRENLMSGRKFVRLMEWPNLKECM